jgi:exopolysaccharide production protein ExoY
MHRSLWSRHEWRFAALQVAFRQHRVAAYPKCQVVNPIKSNFIHINPLAEMLTSVLLSVSAFGVSGAYFFQVLVQVKMSVKSQSVAMARVTAAPSIEAPRPWLYRSLIKRPLDMTLVLLTCPVVLPLVVLFALIVMLDGRNPFYSQQRIGRDGRIFRMWKLRSMVPDADQRLEEHLAQNPQARQEWDDTQKLRDDPRVTGFGRVLRACSMDELPQLWNVVTGDMSLVGPRPMMPDQQGMYSGQGYYRLRPGITGFWQTSGRNKTTFAARAWYDDRYERSLSFASDAAILLRTVSVVLGRTGC